MKKVIIIGSGPGGYTAALKLKQMGADVKIVENWSFGGTCLNRGCIPSKAILEIAHRYHNIREINDFFDVDLNIKLRWEKIKEHKSRVVESLRNSLEKLFVMKRIEIIRGKAKITSPKTIEIEKDDTKISYNFDKLIIATGTKPFYPKPFDSYISDLTDSDKIFDIEKQPKSLTIIGAGVIGIEMACFFNAIGTDINVIDIMPEVLPFEDSVITKVIKNSLEKRGVKFYLGTKASDIKIEPLTKTLILENGDSISSEEIMVAVGRYAELKDLGLELAKVRYQKFIDVNSKLETSNPDIYAIGDVNGISLLAHSAAKQAEIVAENMIECNNKEFDKNIIPSCVYSFPEIASVGMNSKEAKEKGINFKVKKSFFQSIGKAVATKQTEGFIQIIIDDKDTVIGTQIVGGPATEIIHIMSIAIKFKMKTSDLNSIIYAHPTMSEIIMEAINK